MLPHPAVSFIPNEDLERRALSVLRQDEQTSGRTISLPVPVEVLIGRTLKLQVTWVDIADDAGGTILARIEPDGRGGATIQLNQRHLADHFDVYFGTEQYSLAHEVAHWILHYDRGKSEQLALPCLFSTGGAPGLQPAAQPPLLCRHMSNSDRREFQAEKFAAFLLLPTHLVMPLAKSHDLRRPGVIAALAHDCGVSKRAMTRRLAELGLIRFDPKGQMITTPHEADVERRLF